MQTAGVRLKREIMGANAEKMMRQEQAQSEGADA
jgi:hypothetical protein